MHRSDGNGNATHPGGNTPDSQRITTLLQAKQYEQIAVARFEENVYRKTILRHPMNGQKLKIDNWHRFHRNDGERDWMSNRFEYSGMQQNSHARISRNIQAQFSLPRHALGYNKPRLGITLALRCVSDLHIHTQHIYNSNPIDLMQLITYLQKSQEAAEKTGSLLVLGLASTSGWNHASAEYIAGDQTGRTYRHRLLLPLLLDLPANKSHYNDADERLQDFISLYEFTTEHETLRYVERCVETKITAGRRSGLTVKEIAKDLSVDASLVQEVFRKLGETEKYSYESDAKSGGMLLVSGIGES